MSKIAEIRDSAPFLVTQSEGGYLLHHAELSAVSGRNSLDDEALKYLEANNIPFIDYTSSSWREMSAVAGYPGASPLVHLGPYSAMDLAPVELIAGLASVDGFVVKNIPIVIVPPSLIRQPNSAQPRRLENIWVSGLLDANEARRLGLSEMLSWAEKLRTSVSDFVKKGDSTNVVDTNTARSNHRVYGVLFYNLNIAHANDLTAKVTWGRVAQNIADWSSHLDGISKAYPDSGKKNVAQSHKQNADLMEAALSVVQRKIENISAGNAPGL